jgi:hypothetical protein
MHEPAKQAGRTDDMTSSMSPAEQLGTSNDTQEDWKRRALQAEAELRAMPMPTLQPQANTDAVRLRTAAQDVILAFEQLSKAQHPPQLLIARSRCETAMIKLSEALKA